MKCYLCDKEIRGYGNNPEPLAEYDKRVCDACNDAYILPYRIAILLHAELPPRVDIINGIRFRERTARK